MIARLELQQVDVLRLVLNAGLWLLLAAGA